MRCAGACALGSYCPQRSISNTMYPCPAGTYGNVTGLGSAMCAGLCPPGFWCGGGAVSPTGLMCAGGHFGDLPGSTSATCSGECSAGYYCPPGSTSSQEAPCASSSSVFCPAATSSPLPVPPGYYSAPVGGLLASNAFPCIPGSYCVGGVQLECPAGRYGRRSGESSKNCTALCQAGYYCPAGSAVGNAALCGNSSVYCLDGSVTPLWVDFGYFSSGGPATGVARTTQAVCGGGSYCMYGVQTFCPTGTYGAVVGLTSAACSGRCKSGYVCPAGSISSSASPCPAGFFCANGVTSPCPAGTYNINVRARAP